MPRSGPIGGKSGHRKPRSVVFSGRRKWREWLETNHSRRDEIWLVLPKKSAGGDSYRVYYNEALEEALCFGWIDSRIRRLDEKRSLVRFSPRKSSNWSPGNIEKARDLTRRGLMTPAGLKFLPRGLATKSATG